MSATDRTVIGALDDSSAARSVARVTRVVAEMLRARPRALHVAENGGRTAQAAAAAEDLELETREGDVVDVLIAAAEDADVIVLGSTDRPRTGEALGHVARELMVRVPTPVVLVPPMTQVHPGSATMLVPLDGTPQSSPAFQRTCALIGTAACDVTALHVFDDQRLPAFGDQVHHETEAWLSEFTHRHCDASIPVHLELRVGRPADQVLTVAAEQHAALIALGWNQHLDPGRALTLRELIGHSNTPLLLLPIEG